MPGPAVRVGDQTVHGGVVTGPGCPTVMINSMPAACMGDMQACPMVSGTVPHASTPIMMGVPVVVIGGKPAATVGDIFGPPCAGTVAVGSPDVVIGTNPPPAFVLTPKQKAGQAAQESKEKKEEKKKEEAQSWIELELKDSDGEAVANEQYKVVCPDGTVKQGSTDGSGKARIDNIKPGLCKISFPNLDEGAWSLSEGGGAGGGAGAEAGGAAEKDKTDWIEFKVTDEEGNPLANEKYEITLPDGTTRTGELDDQGTMRLEGIPAGKCEVTFPELDESTKLTIG